MKLTRKQREALKALFDRQQTPVKSYRHFRRAAMPEICGNAVMVPWCGMWLGIETDGYTHS